MAGTIGVVLGFSFSSQYGCKCSLLIARTEILTFHHIGSAPATLVPLVMGCAILLLGSIYEKRTSRDALFPPKMFTNTTVGEFDAERIFAFC